MTRFVFNLETLYGQRQRAEELSQREFAGVLAKLMAEETRLSELKALYMAAGEELDGLKEKGSSARDIEMHQAYLVGLRRQVAAQESLVEQYQKLVEKKRAELVEASRNKKVLEVMKEKSLGAHVVRENRREQKEADELTVARMRRKGDED